MNDESKGVAFLPVDSPPAILQIFQECLNPDAEESYGLIEEELAQLCKRMNSPNRYLALASVSLPREIWWLNMYASQADVDRVARGYRDNPALTAAMTELAKGKPGLTAKPVDLMNTLCPDRSDMSRWRVGELPFAVILETATPVNGKGAIFQNADTFFVIEAAANRPEADRLAGTLGEGARIFEVRPQWSFPYAAWVTRNPGLWT